jgi:hypothetical protein
MERGSNGLAKAKTQKKTDFEKSSIEFQESAFGTLLRPFAVALVTGRSCQLRKALKMVRGSNGLAKAKTQKKTDFKMSSIEFQESAFGTLLRPFAVTRVTRRSCYLRKTLEMERGSNGLANAKTQKKTNFKISSIEFPESGLGTLLRPFAVTRATRRSFQLRKALKMERGSNGLAKAKKQKKTDFKMSSIEFLESAFGTLLRPIAVARVTRRSC